jgi:AcrR family transcriptional regulator
LSRDVLIDACIALTDREGADAVTLRRLGAELGVDATAVYRHFRDKDELLAASADRLLTDAFDSFHPTGEWRRDIRGLVLAMRRAYLAHPKMAFMVLTSTSPMPNEARLSEAGLSLVRSLALSEAQAVLIFEVIESYTVATSCMDAMGPPNGDPWRMAYARLSPAEFPSLTATAPLLYQDAEARFEFGLELLLDSIERVSVGRRSRPQPGHPTTR